MVRRIAVLVALLVSESCAPSSTAPPASVAPASTAGQVDASPVGPGVAGLDWRAATDVAWPEDAFPTGPLPTEGPHGRFTAGHPGHFPGQATMTDLVNLADGLIAVGYVGWDWRPVAWTSTDLDHWSLVEIGRAEPTEPAFAVALTPLPGGGGVVAVGRAGHRPIAWTSSDGGAWAAHDVPVIGGPTEWERMTTVASGPLGLLAGGSVGPELLDRRARFWRSQDGVAWTPVADDPGLDGAEVTAITPIADGWLALGRLGTGQRTTGSIAWRSPDGDHWTRVDDPDLARGWARSVTRAGDGELVAVGSEPDEIGAYVWQSTDEGGTWKLAPEEPSRTYAGGKGKARMLDVTVTPTGLLAVGNVVDVQYGTGESWTSTDSVHWDRSPNQPSMGQAEPSAVVPFAEGRYVMIGTFGAPDNYIPRVWISPPN
jgi:hypothetical protein